MAESDQQSWLFIVLGCLPCQASTNSVSIRQNRNSPQSESSPTRNLDHPHHHNHLCFIISSHLKSSDHNFLPKSISPWSHHILCHSHHSIVIDRNLRHSHNFVSNVSTFSGSTPIPHHHHHHGDHSWDCILQ